MAGKKAKGRYPRLKASQFGLPGKGTGKTKGAYPVNTRGRAAAAKGRAKTALRKGHLTKAQFSRIVAKANRKLYGSSKGPR